jgi:hypothetical protein
VAGCPVRALLRPFLADHPGTPLGRGFPSGLTFREDGESHRAAWKRICQRDPCAYCGGPGGTLDHIEPKSRLARTGEAAHSCLPDPLDHGGLHVWLNYSGACERCNSGKSDLDLLDVLYRRRWGTAIRLKKRGVVPRRVAVKFSTRREPRLRDPERTAWLEENPAPRWSPGD